jgi:NADH-quinone oxidoreductase subunit J
VFFTKFLFCVSFLLTCVGALEVMRNKNLMHACIALFACLFGVAGLYATLGADFLMATQLVVYAGGVVILMLFAVMLTGGSENQPNKFGLKKIASMGSPVSFMLAGLSALVIGLSIVKLMLGIGRYNQIDTKTLPPFESTVERIGELLLTEHVLAFEISSILLLGALVGAAVISRPRRQ